MKVGCLKSKFKCFLFQFVVVRESKSKKSVKYKNGKKFEFQKSARNLHYSVFLLTQPRQLTYIPC